MDIAIDRRMLQTATEALRPLLDIKALDYLIDNPATMRAVIAMRMNGKLELRLGVVKHLVSIGVFSLDKDGFYLSEVVEDVIDKLLAEWKQNER